MLVRSPAGASPAAVPPRGHSGYRRTALDEATPFLSAAGQEGSTAITAYPRAPNMNREAVDMLVGWRELILHATRPWETASRSEKAIVPHVARYRASGPCAWSHKDRAAARSEIRHPNGQSIRVDSLQRWPVAPPPPHPT